MDNVMLTVSNYVTLFHIRVNPIAKFLSIGFPALFTLGAEVDYHSYQ